MNQKPAYLSFKFIATLLLVAGLGLSVGLSMERQLIQKSAFEPTPSVETQVNPPAGCQATPPQTPQNLRGWSGPEVGQVSLVWDQVEGVTEYGVNYGVVENFYTASVPGVGSQQTITVSDLDPGRDYYFVVVALNDCAPSLYSQELKLTAFSEGVSKEVVYAQSVPEATATATISPKVSATATPKPEPSPATPAAVLKSEKTSPDPEPAAKTSPEKSIFKGVLPWAFGGLLFGLAIILTRKMIKSQVSQVQTQINDLSKGTEISLNQAQAIKDTIDETESLENF